MHKIYHEASRPFSTSYAYHGNIYHEGMHETQLSEDLTTCAVGADHSQWIPHLVTWPLASSFGAKRHGQQRSISSPSTNHLDSNGLPLPRPSPRMHAVAPAGARESTGHVDILPAPEHILAPPHIT